MDDGTDKRYDYMNPLLNLNMNLFYKFSCLYVVAVYKEGVLS